jgi:hypothetical protein
MLTLGEFDLGLDNFGSRSETALFRFTWRGSRHRFRLGHLVQRGENSACQRNLAGGGETGDGDDISPITGDVSFLRRLSRETIQ